MQIFFFGHYGKKNVGDEAMINVLLAESSKYFNSNNFAVFSPTNIELLPEIKNHVKFVGPKILELFKEIKRSSIFVVGGGTQFYDYGPSFERFLILFKIFLILLFAKFFCQKVYFLGIGVEKPKKIWSKLLIKYSHEIPDFISVRDENSLKVLNELQINTEIILSFDLASLLEFPSKNLHSRNYKILGISIMPYFYAKNNEKDKDWIWVESLANTINNWMKKNCEWNIELFVFNGGDNYGDKQITEKLKACINEQDRVNLNYYNSNFYEVLSVIGVCNAFIGMRYHSCLFAGLLNVPLLVIDLFEKNKSVITEIGLNKNVLVSIDEILEGNLEKYLYLIAKEPENFLGKNSADNLKKRTNESFKVFSRGIK